MRACAVCFFYQGGFGSAEGDCWLNPPAVFLVHDDEGAATFTSIRPTVGSQEFCDRFSHRAGPKDNSPETEDMPAPVETGVAA